MFPIIPILIYTFIITLLFLTKPPLLFDKNAHHQRIFKKEDSAFAEAWAAYYNKRCAAAGYFPCKECANPKKSGLSNTIGDDTEEDNGWVLVTKPKRR